MALSRSRPPRLPSVLTVAFLSSTLAAQNVPVFETAELYPTGTRPQCVVVGDFDGGGEPDLVVANIFSNSISLFLGAGDGVFTPAGSLFTGSWPRAVAAGDLDGDLDLDLAVANLRSDTVRILLNQGDGSFLPAWPSHTVVDGAASVAMADLDGDRDLDLAVANYGDGFQVGSTISVLMNLGGGAFAPHVDYPSGDWPGSVAAGDLDGDGDVDVIVSNDGNGTRPGSTVTMLLNEGDGTFGSPLPFEAGARPSAVALGDLDGDDDLDVAVVNLNGSTVSVLLNTSKGTLYCTVAYAAGALPVAVALGDLDGDDDRDLAIANHAAAGVTVLLNDGDGTFGTPHPSVAIGSSTWVDVGDLNGDGRMDLAVTHDDGLAVLLEGPKGVAVAGSSSPARMPGPAGTGRGQD